MAGSSVHDDFEVASKRKTASGDRGWNCDSGPLVGRWSVVDQDIECRRSVPDTATEIVAVLEGESSSTGRVGEDREFLRVVWLTGFDTDVPAATEGIGPQILSVLGGRSQHLGEGAFRKRAAVLVLRHFASNVVDPRNELTNEVSEPEIVVDIGSHAEGRAKRCKSREVGEFVSLVVKESYNIGSCLTEEELEVC